MKLLLNDRHAPITSEIGFLECDIETAAKAFCLWQNEILEQHGMRVELTDLPGNLDSVLLHLLPLTRPIACRAVFVPTQGRWTAYFDNGARGTDAASSMAVLARRLNCRGLRVVCVPNTMPRHLTRDSRGRFGATILECYGSQAVPLRTIYAANDGGKWRFGESGDRFPFEEIESYQSKRISNRFTCEILDRYLKHLGVAAFDEAFYATTDLRRSIMIRKLGRLPETMKEITRALKPNPEK